jgi:hypothetical protein
MRSNKICNEAMQRTRDSGEATTSGVITLVQEADDDVQKGFLTYLYLLSSLALQVFEPSRLRSLFEINSNVKNNNSLDVMVFFRTMKSVARKHSLKIVIMFIKKWAINLLTLLLLVFKI